MKRLFLLAAVLLIVAPAAHAQYVFEPVVCPGMTVPVLAGINNHGVMVGGYYTADDPQTHALMIKDGECQPLGPDTLLASHWSAAFGVNDRGDVVGAYMDEYWTEHGFLLDKRGVLTTVDFPGAGGTEVCGINESGTIAGYADYFDGEGNYLYGRGFTWTNGVFSTIEIDGSSDDGLLGINARGDVAGYSDSRLFIQAKGVNTVLDVVPGAQWVQGDGINARGEVVGGIIDAGGVPHGFVLAGSVMTQLDFVGLPSFALGINNAGVIVGLVEPPAGPLVWVARPIKKP